MVRVVLCGALVSLGTFEGDLLQRRNWWSEKGSGYPCEDAGRGWYMALPLPGSILRYGPWVLVRTRLLSILALAILRSAWHTFPYSHFPGVGGSPSGNGEEGQTNLTGVRGDCVSTCLFNATIDPFSRCVWDKLLKGLGLLGHSWALDSMFVCWQKWHFEFTVLFVSPSSSIIGQATAVWMGGIHANWSFLGPEASLYSRRGWGGCWEMVGLGSGGWGFWVP